MEPATPPPPPDTRPATRHAMLAREMRVRETVLEPVLDGTVLPRGTHMLREGAFMFHARDGHLFRYRRGEGVFADASRAEDPAARRLWLEGTVHAAVAALNGLMPVHASAIEVKGQAWALLGPSGAGKSTLATALATGVSGPHYPLHCDDTMVLDLSGPQPLALPGHKAAKLDRGAVALSRARAGQAVAGDRAKHYADDVPRTGEDSLPLAGLVVLEWNDGDDVSLVPASLSHAVAALATPHYTLDLYAAANHLGPREQMRALAGIAEKSRNYRLLRPKSAAHFTKVINVLRSVLDAGVTKA